MRGFDYEAPDSVDEVLALLAHHGPDARVLAGGQSLLILMRQRLVSPEVVVSLSRVAELRTVEANGSGLRVGAMTTYREAARDRRLVNGAPLLARAAGSVGSMHIRARGTLGGAVCHADPAGDVLVALMALDGSIETRGPAGTKEVPAAGFPSGLFSTDLGANSIVTALGVPFQPPGARYGYRRFLLREGEYPMTQTAVRLVMAGDAITDARVAIGGDGDRVRRLRDVESWLVGQEVGSGQATLLEGFEEEVRSIVRPSPDVRGGTWWKTQVLAVTARRALADALGTQP